MRVVFISLLLFFFCSGYAQEVEDIPPSWSTKSLGHLAVSNIEYTLDLTQDTWVPVTNATNSLFADKDYIGAIIQGDSIICSWTGTYLVIATLSGVADANTTINLAISKDNVVQSSGVAPLARMDTKTGQEQTNAMLLGSIYLLKNESIKLVMQNVTNSTDYELHYAHIIIFYLTNLNVE